ncbi:hypothetical protein SISSUDRAFT_1054924, partial [Sistotremastrum suecicum HHB10207 ss-3]
MLDDGSTIILAMVEDHYNTPRNFDGTTHRLRVEEFSIALDTFGHRKSHVVSRLPGKKSLGYAEHAEICMRDTLVAVLKYPQLSICDWKTGESASVYLTKYEEMVKRCRGLYWHPTDENLVMFPCTM